MKRIIWIVCALLVGAAVSAGPAGLVVKGAVHMWDEVAKIALKVSGKAADDVAVKAASKSLRGVAAKYGDDAARLAADGGMEVAESIGRHGPAALKIMKKSRALSKKILKEAARHADDMLRLAPKYGDDILRVNAHLPGQSARVLKALKSAGVAEKRGLRIIAEVTPDNAAQVLAVVEKNSRVSDLFLRCVERGGSPYVDKLIGNSHRLALAGGLSTAAVMTAYRMTAASAASAEALTTEQDLAREIIRDPGASAESRRWAEGALGAQRASAESQSLAGVMKHLFFLPLLLAVIILSAGYVFIRYRKVCHGRDRTKEKNQAEQEPQAKISPEQTSQAKM